MEFRQYHPDDLLSILDLGQMCRLGYDTLKDIDESLTWTVVHNNEVLGCGGFRRFWGGVYEAWLIAKSYQIFFDHKIATIKGIKKIFNELSWHRLQATILQGNNRDETFIKFLGFEYEGYMNKFGPDERDYLLYAMVK